MARFATVSKNELEKLLADKDAENTKRVAKLAVNIFTTYLKEKKIKEPDDKESLAAVLKLFYIEARKEDGTAYSKSTLNSFRFGLNRHYLSTRDINIINDSAFNEVNKVFGAKCAKLKRQGLAKVEHKQPICQQHLQKLYECGIFYICNPVTLQNKIFFEVMLCFCRRGRLNFRQLKKTNFS